LNNFFLGVSRADGTLIMPSFHRPWLFNNGLALNDTTNPNWDPGKNPLRKYLTLRPRPLDHLLAGETSLTQDPVTLQWLAATPTGNRPAFPYPSDATGD